MRHNLWLPNRNGSWATHWKIRVVTLAPSIQITVNENPPIILRLSSIVLSDWNRWSRHCLAGMMQILNSEYKIENRRSRVYFPSSYYYYYYHPDPKLYLREISHKYCKNETHRSRHGRTVLMEVILICLLPVRERIQPDAKSWRIQKEFDELTRGNDPSLLSND